MSDVCKCGHGAGHHAKYVGSCGMTYEGSGCELHVCSCRKFAPPDRAVRLSESELAQLVDAFLWREGGVEGNPEVIEVIVSIVASRERAAAEKAWQQGIEATDTGAWCQAHRENDYCGDGNPYRQEDRNG